MSAMPEAPNAIRVNFDEDEPPALAFNPQAMPGALVSWSWCQLTTLQVFLSALIQKGSSRDGEPDVAGAVCAIVGPVINALAFSEQRAEEVRREALDAPSSVTGKRAARRKKER